MIVINGITPMTVINAPKIIVRNKVLKLNTKQNAQDTFFLEVARLVCWAHRPVPVPSRGVESSHNYMLERKIPQLDSTSFQQCDRGVQDFSITTNASAFEA